eukprot:SAG31_NODE_3574_length_4113_cov_2.614848_1_plen_213_part_10
MHRHKPSAPCTVIQRTTIKVDTVAELHKYIQEFVEHNLGVDQPLLDGDAAQEFAGGVGGAGDRAHAECQLDKHHSQRSDAGIAPCTKSVQMIFEFPHGTITDKTEPDAAKYMWECIKALVVPELRTDSWSDTALLCNVNDGSANAGKGTNCIYIYLANCLSAPRGQRSEVNNLRITGRTLHDQGKTKHQQGKSKHQQGKSKYSKGEDKYSKGE